MRALRLVLTVLFETLRALGRSRSDLILENLALRQQIAVFTRTKRRPCFEPEDRMVWIALRRSWSRWNDALFIVVVNARNLTHFQRLKIDPSGVASGHPVVVQFVLFLQALRDSGLKGARPERSERPLG